MPHQKVFSAPLRGQKRSYSYSSHIGQTSSSPDSRPLTVPFIHRTHPLPEYRHENPNTISRARAGPPLRSLLHRLAQRPPTQRRRRRPRPPAPAPLLSRHHGSAPHPRRAPDKDGRRQMAPPVGRRVPICGHLQRIDPPAHGRRPGPRPGGEVGRSEPQGPDALCLGWRPPREPVSDLLRG